MPRKALRCAVEIYIKCVSIHGTSESVFRLLIITNQQDAYKGTCADVLALPSLHFKFKTLDIILCSGSGL